MRGCLFLCVYLIKFVSSEENVTEQIVLKVNNNEATLLPSPPLLHLSPDALLTPHHQRNGVLPLSVVVPLNSSSSSDGAVATVIVFFVFFGMIFGCVVCCVMCARSGACGNNDTHHSSGFGTVPVQQRAVPGQGVQYQMTPAQGSPMVPGQGSPMVQAQGTPIGPTQQVPSPQGLPAAKPKQQNVGYPRQQFAAVPMPQLYLGQQQQQQHPQQQTQGTGYQQQQFPPQAAGQQQQVPQQQFAAPMYQA